LRIRYDRKSRHLNDHRPPFGGRFQRMYGPDLAAYIRSSHRLSQEISVWFDRDETILQKLPNDAQ
jgi:hypothetical protein